MAELDVMVLMGSASDRSFADKTMAVLDGFGLVSRVHVSSAHRTPERTIRLVREAEESGCKVFICLAGMAAHLAGVVAAHTVRPVLGVPLPGGLQEGTDALMSTVQMPSGIPVACFAVGSAGAKNAAFFAAQVVSGVKDTVRQKLLEARAADAEKIEFADRELQSAHRG